MISFIVFAFGMVVGAVLKAPIISFLQKSKSEIENLFKDK